MPEVGPECWNGRVKLEDNDPNACCGELPDGVDLGSLLSVSPDLARLAYASGDAMVAFRPRQGSAAETELPLPSLTGAGISWPGDDEFAALFVGPAPSMIVVCLAN